MHTRIRRKTYMNIFQPPAASMKRDALTKRSVRGQSQTRVTRFRGPAGVRPHRHRQPFCRIFAFRCAHTNNAQFGKVNARRAEQSWRKLCVFEADTCATRVLESLNCCNNCENYTVTFFIPRLILCTKHGKLCMVSN